MKAKEEVSVVIPVYREPADYEKISLQQCLKVLGQYPITLVAAESMNVSSYLALRPFAVERFDDSFFTGTTSYSRLLLSKAFYRRFQSYEYILIYQLDAFVFSNRLMEFCRKGYDYIGAPIPRWGWPELRKRVGNGGCSLRRVSSCLRVLSEWPPEQVFSIYPRSETPEDFYFACCSDRAELNFRVPGIQEAAEFSVDNERCHCYRRLDKRLPFACHSWHKKLRVWKSIIESFGYRLHHLDIVQEDGRKTALRDYVFRRLARKGKGESVARKAMDEVVRSYEPLALWGYGQIGRRWMSISKAFGFPQPIVFDQHAENEDVDVIRPSRESIAFHGRFILITSSLYAKEIVRELQQYGLQKDRDFMDVGQMLDEIGARYYHAVFHS